MTLENLFEVAVCRLLQTQGGLKKQTFKEQSDWLRASELDTCCHFKQNQDTESFGRIT